MFRNFPFHFDNSNNQEMIPWRMRDDKVEKVLFSKQMNTYICHRFRITKV